MKQSGQIVAFSFPQTDLEEGKLRPALLLSKLPGDYDNWLVCMISSQVRQYVTDFDEMIQESDDDFEKSGLKITSDRMLDALANGAMDDIRKKNKRKAKKQGNARDGWVIVDYGDVVVHLFSPDQGDFYNIEELWVDGKVLLKLK